MWDPSQPFTKDYNVKHVLSSGETMFKVTVYSHEPMEDIETDGWMTDLAGGLPTLSLLCERVDVSAEDRVLMFGF